MSFFASSFSGLGLWLGRGLSSRLVSFVRSGRSVSVFVLPCCRFRVVFQRSASPSRFGAWVGGGCLFVVVPSSFSC